MKTACTLINILRSFFFFFWVLELAFAFNSSNAVTLRSNIILNIDDLNTPKTKVQVIKELHLKKVNTKKIVVTAKLQFYHYQNRN